MSKGEEYPVRITSISWEKANEPKGWYLINVVYEDGTKDTKFSEKLHDSIRKLNLEPKEPYEGNFDLSVGMTKPRFGKPKPIVNIEEVSS